MNVERVNEIFVAVLTRFQRFVWLGLLFWSHENNAEVLNTAFERRR